MILTIALSYGAREEIENVIKKSIKGRGGHNLHTLLKECVVNTTPKSTEVFVDILYADGDIWRYKERSLMKENGPEFFKIPRRQKGK